jgi:DNA-binding CsgD family transcriptional regulator
MARASEANNPAVTEERLSRRRLQTLGFLVEGKSEKEVAAKLGISRHTAHTHIKGIYREFGVATRGELHWLILRSVLSRMHFEPTGSGCVIASILDALRANPENPSAAILAVGCPISSFREPLSAQPRS